MRKLLVIAMILFLTVNVNGYTRTPIVADSLTRSPLANASVFDNKGKFIGMSNADGSITCAASTDYPITIRYMGYHEKTVAYDHASVIYLNENITQLPEVVVESKQTKILHILAYVREYSTLASYTDTVTLFREKMVDYMLPGTTKTKFKGWNTPRVLSSKSYYQFTNAKGLDSVSDRCNQHFTWSDWVGIIPDRQLPAKLRGRTNAADTLYGRYVPAEIWNKSDGNVTVDIDVMADTTSREWVPDLSSFFSKDNIDFEEFRMRLNYNDVSGDYITTLDLTGYSFSIESRGRGHGMFQFNRYDEPFFVTTYTEVYILDKEYITVKEAKKWDKNKIDAGKIQIYEPENAPELHPTVQALVDRVNKVDSVAVRLTLTPDYRLAGRNIKKQNFSFGHRALSLLKDLLGITSYKFHRNTKKKWNEFKRGQIQNNNGSF